MSDQHKKIMIIAGARPNFMKVSSIINALQLHNRSGREPLDYLLVHTGQHYDEAMSTVFFEQLGIPAPAINLEVGSSSHANQTAEIMKKFEPILLREQPDALVVVGDVNSTIACTLVGSKIDFRQVNAQARTIRPLLIHVEAGLRSFDRSMPEEINRILTDSISDMLFVTEESAVQNLTAEGISSKKVFFVGNTMVDTLLRHRAQKDTSRILEKLNLVGEGMEEASVRGTLSSNSSHLKKRVKEYAVATLHRPSNVDDPYTLGNLLKAFDVIGKKVPILFPAHPRTWGRVKEFALETFFSTPSVEALPSITSTGLYRLPPLGYVDFTCLLSHAKFVLTDSGGIQEETTILGVPCITLRENTERPVTITHGTNVLAGIQPETIIQYAFDSLQAPTTPMAPQYWDGRAGERIVECLVQALSKKYEAARQ